MQEWKWFTGEKREKEKTKNPTETDYKSLARNPIPALTKDPGLLFKVVGFEKEECMCGGSFDCCGAGEDVDVLFIDLMIQYQSFKESDLVNLQKLDWFRLSTHLPLSIPTLEKYQHKVNWKEISKSYLYEKNAPFIRKFHKQLDMNNLYPYSTDLTVDEACKLIFEEMIVPLHIGRVIPKNIILSKVKEHAEYIGQSIDNTTYFIRCCGAKETEDTFLNVSGALKIDPKEFAERCYSDNYIPKTKRFIDILKKGVDWSTFLLCCKPDIEFIEAHIVPGASKDTWYIISECPQLTTAFIEKYAKHLDMRKVAKHHQFDTPTLKKILGDWKVDYGGLSVYTKLTPEFIDEYADKLDWYNLCEHQQLPEWLLNKHKDRLNWGQISLYQALSPQFIQENKNMLNEVKLRQNKGIKHIAMLL
jgi:hypothetical protein